MKLIITPEMRATWKRINAKRVKAGKPKLNFPLFVKVRNRIDAIPESYDQEVFAKNSDSAPCGTAACLAGETIICAAPSVALGIKELFKLDRGCRFNPSRVPRTAADKLGLEGDFFMHEEETAIFSSDPDAWPKRFYDQFRKGREAKAAVGFLTHIIKTGKVIA